MSYFLIATILVALIAVLYVWYVTRCLNSIPNDKPVPLDTDDDKVLIHWYKMNIKHSYDIDSDDTIAAKYLQRIHNIDITSSLLVIGNDLDTQYSKLTRQRLQSVYTPDADCIFDLRSTLGKTGQIAIVHNNKIRESLKRTNTFDITDLSLIINNELDIVARDYLRDVLNFRWEQLLQLNDPNILNNEGSYLYLQSPDDSINGFPVTVLGGSVTAMTTSRGARINLLCSNYEFEALIERWKLYLLRNPTNINSLGF